MTASQTLVLPVRRGPAITTLAPPASAPATSRTSDARPIIWLAGIGWSVGKRSALRWRLTVGLILCAGQDASCAISGARTVASRERPYDHLMAWSNGRSPLG